MPSTVLRARVGTSFRARRLGVVLSLIAATLIAPVLTPPAAAAPGAISFVNAASTAGNRTAHTVQLPAGVQAGDVLVLTLTTNSTTSTITDTIAGWTLLQSRDGN